MKNKSPIYFVNITGNITTGNSKKVSVVVVNGLVVKGTEEQIKNSERVKRKFLKKYLKDWAKVKIFDLNTLKIINVEILENLGFGVSIK